MSRLLQHCGLFNNQFFIEQYDLLLLEACDYAPIVEGGGYYCKQTPLSTIGASHMHMLPTIGNPFVIRCSNCGTIQNVYNNSLV